jgi:hypothetical protein
MQSILTHFPVTSILIKVAQEANEEINKSSGNSWYLNLPIWLALAPFFMVALIPTLLADSVFHVYTIFDLGRSNIMSFKDFIKNQVPEGVKKIVLTLAVAVAAVVALNLLSSSVYLMLFALKAAVVIAAITHIVMVIHENMPNIREAAGTALEKVSEFLDKRRANISNFFKAFTFRIKKETGAPIVQGVQNDEPANAPEYEYFPYFPSRTDVYNSLYNSLPGNPISWIYSRSTEEAQSLSGMRSDAANQDSGLETEQSGDRPSSRLSNQ